MITAIDPYDSVRGGLTALPDADAEAAGGLFTRGTGAGQINQQTNGQIDTNVERWLNGAVAAGVTGRPSVDVRHWVGGSVGAPDVTGVPIVQVDRWRGGFNVNNLVSGRVDASVGAMAANTMTASALATDAVAEIADGVWDESLAGHVTTGSAGEALSDAGGAPTAADVADAVWDEATSGHVSAGTFGAGVKLVDGAITAAKFAADAITSTVFATSAAQKIRDSILTYALDTGRTVEGFLRRSYAFWFGKVTGQKSSTVTAYKSDGTTVEFTVSQDTTAGSRQSAGAES